MNANRIIALLTALILSLFHAPSTAAERIEQAPKELEEVGVEEHLSQQIPLDLAFVESTSKEIQLRDVFDGKRPVVLTMNYSNCPMLCSLQLNGLFEGLQSLEWDIGENFQMVTVSIDSKETPQRSELTKKKYLKLYGRPGVSDSWHVLTGREPAIKKLARTVGFGYTYVPDTKEYAHPAVTIICTPDGKVSRYLYGIEYDPQTLKLSLMEAAEGKIGSTLDQMILYCFHYDAEKGRYGPAAVKIMRLGGAAAVVMLAGMVAIFWRRGQQRFLAAEPQAVESRAAESQDSQR